MRVGTKSDPRGFSMATTRERIDRRLGHAPGKPVPGVDFFKSSPRSPIVTAMGRRLVEAGCSAYASGPGPQWTAADNASFRLFQRKIGDAPQYCDGWPGRRQWDALKVPKV